MVMKMSTVRHTTSGFISIVAPAFLLSAIQIAYPMRSLTNSTWAKRVQALGAGPSPSLDSQPAEVATSFAPRLTILLRVAGIFES